MMMMMCVSSNSFFPLGICTKESRQKGKIYHSSPILDPSGGALFPSLFLVSICNLFPSDGWLASWPNE